MLTDRLILESIDYKSFGIPPFSFEKWSRITDFDGEFLEPLSSEKPIKNPEIPLLPYYENDPGVDFWDKFPYNPLPDPDKPNTPIDGEAFGRLYIPLMDEFTPDVQAQMIKCQADLLFGADSLVDFDKVQPLYDPNSKSLFKPKVGSLFTDQLVSLVKKKYVSGPFAKKPFENLRINSMFCVEQKVNISSKSFCPNPYSKKTFY